MVDTPRILISNQNCPTFVLLQAIGNDTLFAIKLSNEVALFITPNSITFEKPTTFKLFYRKYDQEITFDTFQG